MKKSIYSEKHKKLCALLIEARKKSGLTQQELADKIGKPQSFVAKYEGGERRLDVIELMEIAALIGLDTKTILKLTYLVSLPRYRLLLRRPWLPYDLLELPDIDSYLYSSTFAVNLDIAKTITETMHNLELTRIKISPVNNGLIMDARGSEKVALFKDGLALLAPGYIQPDSEGRVFQRTHKGELRAISHF